VTGLATIRYGIVLVTAIHGVLEILVAVRALAALSPALRIGLLRQCQ